MLKMALLMGGEFRTFYHCYDTWESNLNDKIEFDLFLSTWKTSSIYSNKNIADNKKIEEFSIDQEEIKSRIGTRLKYLNIENEINFTHRGNKQLYHWFKLLTFFLNYKNEYDYAFITRPDVKQTNNELDFVTTLKKINKNVLYAPSDLRVDRTKHFKFTMHDIYFLGTPNLVIESLIYIPLMKTLSVNELIEGKGINLHNHLADYMFKNKVNIKPFMSGSIKDSSWIMRDNGQIYE